MKLFDVYEVFFKRLKQGNPKRTIFRYTFIRTSFRLSREELLGAQGGAKTVSKEFGRAPKKLGRASAGYRRASKKALREGLDICAMYN